MNLFRPIVYPLSEHVKAFSTTRRGGVGRGNYATMNVTHYCGDDEQHVQENRRILAEWLGTAPERIIVPKQTHQTEVRLITEENFLQKERLEGVDAIVTTTPGICIGVSTADCIPIILYDGEKQAVAAIHAGWRGTVNRIAEKTIRCMEKWCGSRPDDLRAVIGPGISLEAFEVGDEVYDAFRQAGFDMQHIAKRFPASSETTKEKWHIDLWECNRHQLIECGIPDKHIRLSGICTYQQCEDFFSARRLGILSGRIYTGVMLLPNK